MSGGAFNASGEVRVGTSATNTVATVGTGTVNVTGGIATVGSITAGRGNDNTDKVNGIVNVSAGTLTSVGAATFGFAGAANNGTLNLSGTGTVNVGTAAATQLIVSTYDTSSGTVNVTGGNLNLNSGSSIRFTIGNTGTVSTNAINQSAGNVSFYGDNAATLGGNGVLDLQNSGAAGVNNTYNLDGGTLTVPQIISTLKTGTRTFNFNGGTLRPATSGLPAASFMPANSATVANVRNGGAIIDTRGIDANIGQALVHSTVSGDNGTDGGLTKLGAGTLTLSGAASYNGPTSVNAGTLGFSTTPSSISTVNVATGARLGATAAGAGVTTLAATALTFAANSGLAFNLNGLANPTAALINDTGTLTLNGALNVSLVGGGGLTTTPNNTTIPLLTYAALSGAGAFVLATPNAGHTTYAFNPTANTLFLSVSALSNVWKGTVNGVWDINATPNWSAPDQKYLDGDNVIFDDTGATTAVNIATTVNPTSVTFANSAKTYTLGGAAIAGAGNLSVTNGGTVVLLNNNTYSGATTIGTGATLRLGNGTAGNDGTLSASTAVLDNGTLVYNRAGANTAAYSISGTGNVVVTGPGTQTLSGINAFTGTTTVNGGGTLSVAADAALGGAGSTVTLDNGTLTTTAGFAPTHAVNINPAGGTINVTTNGQLYLSSANLLTGSGPLTLVGGNGTLQPNIGNLRVGSANAFNGPVTVRSGGIFEYGVAAAVDAASVFTVGNEGELALQTGVSMPNAVTVGGTNSVLSFENGNTGNYAGPITLAGNATIGLRDWYNYATVRSGIISGTITGAAGLTVNSGTGTGGTLTLNAANAYTGGTVANASKLVAGNSAAFGTGPVTISGTNAQLTLTSGVNVADPLTITQGNFNYDNVTDFNDFIAIQTNYGQSVTGANVSFTSEQVGIMNAFFAANTTEVPEQASLAVLGLGATALLRRRRAC